jgi:hypothetical protein
LSAAEAAARSDDSGCYDLRGPDFSTLLIGPVTERVIDADRLVRLEWKNGFPNWLLYRVAIVGDEIGRRELRQWIVMFTHAYCADGGVRRDAYSDDLATFAAWDAYSLLVHGRQVQPYTVTAAALEVDPKTYKRLRERVCRRLKASMDEYWLRLECAIRHIVLSERKSRS